MMIKSLAWFAFVIACSPFLLVAAAINRMAREKGTERYHDEDDGLGEDDPGVDVDAEPINVDGTITPERCSFCGEPMDAYGLCPNSTPPLIEG